MVQALAEKLGWTLQDDKKLQVSCAKGVYNGSPLHLCVPLTYMNESGRAAKNYLSYYKIHTDELIAVVDDCDLPFGQIRIKPSGSSGGHNGIKDLERFLNTTNFVRLRMGIGAKHPGQDLANYVLENFTAAELVQLHDHLDKGVEALTELLKHPVEQVMSSFNFKVKNSSDSGNAESGEK
jgi:PTH1 family peptidyl-tRNA hydrolase